MLKKRLSPEQIIMLIGIGLAVSLLGDASLYLILPVHYDEAGILVSQVGLMLSANRLIRLFVNGPYGVLIERIPRRRLLIPSLFIGGLASLLYTVPGFWPLLIGRIIWGIAWSGLYIASTTVVLDISTDINRGYFVGRFQMWFFIGMGSSSLLGGLLFDAIGYVNTFYVSAFIIGLGTLLWWLFLPETRPIEHHLIEHHPIDVKDSLKPVNPLPYIPLTIAIITYGLMWLLFIGMSTTVLPLLLNERVGAKIMIASLLTIQLVSFTGILTALNTIISLIISPISGWFTDRSGNRWILVLIAILVGIIGLSIEATGTGFIIIVATSLNAGVMGILSTQLIALVGDYAPVRRGRILGIQNTVGDFGGAMGPLLAFSLYPIIGLEGLFTAAALLLIMLLPFIVWMSVKQAASNKLIIKPSFESV